ncbi:MAG TPA: hypothetical protein VNT55_14075 [Baekduia sp.]|nr:hypothetical protein [Baekduia sp.]
MGRVYKRELLHSQAIYRVVGVDDDHVEVEAVDVPGLPEGFHMRLTAASVAEMEPLLAPAGAAAQRDAAEAREAGAEPRFGLA